MAELARDDIERHALARELDGAHGAAMRRSRHRRDYRPEGLDNPADDVTIGGSVLAGIADGPEAIRAILGFARTLYEYQEFNFVGRYGDGAAVVAAHGQALRRHAVCEVLPQP